MPRKMLPPRKAKTALDNLRLEAARRAAVVERRAFHTREAALALRKTTPDWVEMDAQLKQLQLEAEMDAMEAALDARRPHIPILNFDLMPGFSPPEKHEPAPPKPEVHPDVLIQAKLTAAEAARSANENAPPPPPTHLGDKNWKYESTIEGRRPEDDWRNWE